MKQERGIPFTLIELLIVIAIIAMLMVLLLPVLRNAKERGATINCLSNLRQNYIAIMAYSNDFNNVFMYSMTTLQEPSTPGWPRMLYKMDYARHTTTFFCPKEIPPRTISYWNTFKRCYGFKTAGWPYSMYWEQIVTISSSEKYYFVILNKIRHPSVSSLLIDSYVDESTNSTFGGYQYSFISLFSLGGAPHAKHGHRINLGYADGHVISESSKQMKEELISELTPESSTFDYLSLINSKLTYFSENKARLNMQ